MTQQVQLQAGQCGLCTHFGESHAQEPRLVQIRTKHEAPDDFVDVCGHPTHAALKLQVTPISGCAGFIPAPEAHLSAD